VRARGIESRWVSKPLACAAQLRPRRPNVRAGLAPASPRSASATAAAAADAPVSLVSQMASVGRLIEDSAAAGQSAAQVSVICDALMMRRARHLLATAPH
jgi:hypothetical protein